MHSDVVRAGEIVDPRERATVASRLVVEFEDARKEAARIRREALEELVGAGMTHKEAADLLGTTRARIGQIIKTGPPSERAFLGSGPLTIALGGKREENKRGSGRVLAQEDLSAYNHLHDLAKSMELAATSEVIEPPGFLNLNRDNLIVICGPRLSPMLNQILESDEALGFREDDLGWFLEDRTSGQIYRSPMDSGKSKDYAYLGRLPRLDGRGHFLYIAGIHAVGAPGAVHFIENNLSYLYKEVRKIRFSTLIGCTFDPDSLEIISSEQVTPFYKGDKGSV